MRIKLRQSFILKFLKNYKHFNSKENFDKLPQCIKVIRFILESTHEVKDLNTHRPS